MAGKQHLKASESSGLKAKPGSLQNRKPTQSRRRIQLSGSRNRAAARTEPKGCQVDEVSETSGDEMEANRQSEEDLERTQQPDNIGIPHLARRKKTQSTIDVVV